MKVEQATPPFQPVTITLETQEEVSKMRHCLRLAMDNTNMGSLSTFALNVRSGLPMGVK